MLAIGLSPFLMNLCSCLIVLLINNGLKDFGGDMYIGAYGIVNRIVFLFIMIVMGFNQGMQPIAGYNFGARQLSRMIQVLKYTTLCAITVTTLGFLICQSDFPVFNPPIDLFIALSSYPAALLGYRRRLGKYSGSGFYRFDYNRVDVGLAIEEIQDRGIE